MIDGRGRARITDFGLAVGVDDDKGGREVAGHAGLHGARAARGQGLVRAERHLRARPRALRAVHRAQGASRPRRSPSWRRKHARSSATSPVDGDAGHRPGRRARHPALPREGPERAARAPSPPSPPRCPAATRSPPRSPPARRRRPRWSPRRETRGAITPRRRGLADRRSWAWLLGVRVSPPHTATGTSRSRSPRRSRRTGEGDHPAARLHGEARSAPREGFSGNGEYPDWLEQIDAEGTRAGRTLATGRPAVHFWYRQSPEGSADAGALPRERLQGPGSEVTESDPSPRRSPA